MKKITAILTVILALVLSFGLYSCSQQENTPTSSTSPEGEVLLKPVSALLVGPAPGTQVVGSVKFAATTPDCKVTVVVTDGIQGTYQVDLYSNAGGFITTVPGDLVIGSNGRGRFTGTVYGHFWPATTYSLYVRVISSGYVYENDPVNVYFK